MQSKEKNLIVELSFNFSVELIAYIDLLEGARKYTIATQLLKSGTSIGANIREAQNAESRADFIHKMKIAAKEADETQYWLKLCDHSRGYPPCNDLISKSQSIINVLSKIIASTKNKIPT